MVHKLMERLKNSKAFHLLMALALVVSSLPVQAFAAEAQTLAVQRARAGLAMSWASTEIQAVPRSSSFKCRMDRSSLDTVQTTDGPCPPMAATPLMP